MGLPLARANEHMKILIRRTPNRALATLLGRADMTSVGAVQGCDVIIRAIWAAWRAAIPSSASRTMKVSSSISGDNSATPRAEMGGTVPDDALANG